MHRFTTSMFVPTLQQCVRINVTATRRMMSVAVTPVATNAMRRGRAQAPRPFLAARWYQTSGYSQQQYPPHQQLDHQYQQQQMYPPPPQYAAHPPPPMQQQQQQPVYVMPPPQADIGTKERPLVVVSAPAPRHPLSFLWISLICVIGLSAALNIFEEVEARMGDQSQTKGAGGAAGGRFGSMFGNNESVQPVNLDEQHTTFSDIQGVDEAKKELEEIVMFLKDPSRFTALGGRLPRGALLVGPPGCGKTMLAKAIAKEAGVNFFYCSGSEFDEMFVGVGSRRVRELFAAAKAGGPSLIFIDEIDALGGKRSSRDQSYSRMTLNQLLSEMDGFKNNDEVIVLGATNTPDSLDKALTRPGRFDTTVAVDPPDMKGRKAILEVYLQKIKKDATVIAAEIARSTAGFTGAELSNLINVAAIRAAVLNKKEVTADEMEYAKDRVMMGSENTSKVIPEEEKRVTAYHEGGHALVAMLLEKDGADPVHKATIIPRGSGIMGLVQQQPKDDRYSQSKRQLETRLRVCLGGRVAEEMILGADGITTGASSDFQQATRVARAMVRQFGFNTSLGTIDYESADTQEGAFMSDSTKAKIEGEIRTLVHDAYTETQQMLTDNRAALDRIATTLQKEETLTGDQLLALMRNETMPAGKCATPPPPPPPSSGTPVLNLKPIAITTSNTNNSTAPSANGAELAAEKREHTE